MQPVDLNLRNMPILYSKKSTEEFHYGQFPDHFKWGSTSSAYQVEGACNIDGKGQTWWDTLCRKSRKAIIDRTRGDMAADSYRQFEKDVMLLKAMNATCYKFSLSWTRILPNGDLSEINKSGLDYYDDLINTLLENGIEPIVVLYHWDFPQVLVDQFPSTWQDEKVLNIFGSYVKLCFKTFGDRVKRWVTIHDPWSHSIRSFGNGTHPPEIQGWSDGVPYDVYKQFVKAHSLAYRIYDEEFRLKQKGTVGVSGNSKFIASKFSVLKEFTRDVNSTRLSPWTELLKCPFDFIVLDHEANETVLKQNDLSRPSDNVCLSSNRSLRHILKAIKDNCNNPKILLCAQGLQLQGDNIRNLVNLEQIMYFKQIANEVLKSVVIDECNVIGFLPGTLVDSWEWEYGFTISYGLHRVDFDHPEKPRSARSSAKYLYNFKTNGFSKDWDIGTIALN